MKSCYETYARTEYYPEITPAKPHTHEYHEIFMLLDGNVDFFVEGTKFPLNSGDIVIISAGDPHTKLVTNKKPYKCFVIYLECDYFKINNCIEYEKIFTSHLCTEHKINAETSNSSGFYDAYERLKTYTSNFSDTHNSITNSIIIEMMHILNNNSRFSSNYISNPQVQQILEFINENYCNKISLKNLADKFFMSKYYICKIFKKYTGYTINKYITHKRITQTKMLVRQGHNITSACTEAGFSDYSSFYKAFLKETGNPPGKMLKE